MIGCELSNAQASTTMGTRAPLWPVVAVRSFSRQKRKNQVGEGAYALQFCVCMVEWQTLIPRAYLHESLNITALHPPTSQHI